MALFDDKINVEFSLRLQWNSKQHFSKKILRAGVEPATYGFLVITATVHRSTNWAIEGSGNYKFQNKNTVQNYP